MRFGIKLLVFIEIIVLITINPIFAKDDRLLSVNELKGLETISLTETGRPNQDKNRIIITYRNDHQDNIAKLGLNKEDFVAGQTSAVGVDILETKTNINSEKLINKIKQNKIVESVAYDEIVRADEIPNDTYVGNQSYYSQINAQDSWNLGAYHPVKVATIDTGLDTTHEDLQGRYLLEGRSYIDNSIEDESGHGTEVAGIINASTDNAKGIAGICGNSNVKIVPYKILNSANVGYVSNLVLALRDIAKTDIKVINLSLSLNDDNPALKSALEDVRNTGKTVVAATGNQNSNQILYPARYDSVIAVGAVNGNNQRCTEADWGTNHGSNYGEGTDYVAPGNNIFSTSSRFGPSTYNTVSGTSVAAPMVSGTIALLNSLDPNLTDHSIRSILNNTSKDLGNPGYDTEYGNGLINVGNAVDELKNPKKDQVYFPVNNLTLYINESYRLHYRTDLDSNFNWNSSDPNVVTVNNGELHAVNFGSADITVTSTEVDTVKATCHVLVSPAGINITAHSENEGWLQPVHSLGMAGTTGKNQKLEALIINTDDPNLNLRGRVHIENLGTTDYLNENSELGSTGFNDGIEALQLDLTGSDAHYYQLYYRAHIENYGWTNWVTNNEWVGTTGYNLQVEAIEISLQPAGTEKPNVEANVVWTYNFQ